MASKKRIFISFDFDQDKKYRYLLTAWDQNDQFDFEFYDASLNIAVNSSDAAYVKSVIKPKVLRATHLVCIVGEETYKSSWVNWESDTAVNAGKKIVGVKISHDNISPVSLLGVGAKWARSFEFDAIKLAVDAA